MNNAIIYVEMKDGTLNPYDVIYIKKDVVEKIRNCGPISKSICVAITDLNKKCPPFEEYINNYNPIEDYFYYNQIDFYLRIIKSYNEKNNSINIILGGNRKLFKLGTKAKMLFRRNIREEIYKIVDKI